MHYPYNETQETDECWMHDSIIMMNQIVVALIVSLFSKAIISSISLEIKKKKNLHFVAIAASDPAH